MTVEMTYCALTVEFCYFVAAPVDNGVIEMSPVDGHQKFRVELFFVFATFLFRLLLLDTNILLR